MAKQKRIVSNDEISTVAENVRRSSPQPLTPDEAEAIVRRGIDQSPGFQAQAPESSTLLGQYAQGGQATDYQMQELSAGRDPGRFSAQRRKKYLKRGG